MILKEITDPAELTLMMDNGEVSVYAVYRPHVEARDQRTAIKEATVGDYTVDEGVYVAVPKSSFQPKPVKQTIDITIG